MKRPRLAVVVSTYEWPEALDAVLRAFDEQSDRDFSLVVADDGSGSATEAVVERWRPSFEPRLTRVTQSDDGFRLARVLNLGALAVDADYLVFMHGESIPRRNFARAMRSCRNCASVRPRCPGPMASGRRSTSQGRPASSSSDSIAILCAT